MTLILPRFLIRKVRTEFNPFFDSLVGISYTLCLLSAAFVALLSRAFESDPFRVS